MQTACLSYKGEAGNHNILLDSLPTLCQQLCSQSYLFVGTMAKGADLSSCPKNVVKQTVFVVSNIVQCGLTHCPRTEILTNLVREFRIHGSRSKPIHFIVLKNKLLKLFKFYIGSIGSGFQVPMGAVIVHPKASITSMSCAFFLLVLGTIRNNTEYPQTHYQGIVFVRGVKRVYVVTWLIR